MKCLLALKVEILIGEEKLVVQQGLHMAQLMGVQQRFDISIGTICYRNGCNWCCRWSYTWRCSLCSNMLVVIMDFKSFIIGLVVGIFGPYMDDLIRKIFSKSSKKDTDSTL